MREYYDRRAPEYDASAKRYFRADELREELHGEVALETPGVIALVARRSGRFRGM